LGHPVERHRPRTKQAHRTSHNPLDPTQRGNHSSGPMPQTTRSGEVTMNSMLWGLSRPQDRSKASCPDASEDIMGAIMSLLAAATAAH